MQFQEIIDEYRGTEKCSKGRKVEILVEKEEWLVFKSIKGWRERGLERERSSPWTKEKEKCR